MAGWRRALLGLVLPLPLCETSAAAADGTRTRPLVADVVPVAAEAGPVQMLPAVRLALETTLDSFDRDHPRGSDYVIVPAVHHSDDPRLRAWLQRQAAARGDRRRHLWRSVGARGRGAARRSHGHPGTGTRSRAFAGRSPASTGWTTGATSSTGPS